MFDEYKNVLQEIIKDSVCERSIKYALNLMFGSDISEENMEIMIEFAKEQIREKGYCIMSCEDGIVVKENVNPIIEFDCSDFQIICNYIDLEPDMRTVIIEDGGERVLYTEPYSKELKVWPPEKDNFYLS